MIDLIDLLKKSQKRILTLHPALQVRAFELIKRAYKAGYGILITQALRTIEEQEKLYAQGRTTPGPIVTWVRRSYHNFGLAFDFSILTDDGTDIDWDDNNPGYMTVVELGEGLGLESGSRWQPSQRDIPHFQLTFGLSINDLINGATPGDVEIPTYEEPKEEIRMILDSTAVIKLEDKTIGGFVLDGHTFAPIREIAELLGLNVGWENGTVTLTKK